MSANEESLLTVQDVARRFNVPVSWVYAQAEADKLPHVKLGRYLRFVPAQVEAHLLAQRRGGDECRRQA